MIIYLLLLVLLGMLGGWLVNYLADVLPSTRSFSRPACQTCETQLSWSEYFFFRKCHTCGSSRKRRAYAIQILVIAGTFYLWFLPPHKLEFLFAFPLFLYLLLVGVIDVEHRLILHIVSLAGAALGLGIGTYRHGLLPTLLGGAAGYGIMLVFYFFGEVFAKAMARRRNEPLDEVALGFGDVNLAGITGLLLGWPIIIYGLLFTILAGGVVSLVIVAGMMIRRQYRAFMAIPYAPFLILSVLVLLFRP